MPQYCWKQAPTQDLSRRPDARRIGCSGSRSEERWLCRISRKLLIDGPEIPSPNLETNLQNGRQHQRRWVELNSPSIPASEGMKKAKSMRFTFCVCNDRSSLAQGDRSGKVSFPTCRDLVKVSLIVLCRRCLHNDFGTVRIRIAFHPRRPIYRSSD